MARVPGRSYRRLILLDLSSPSRQQEGVPTMIVDCHSHLFPPQWASSGHMPPNLFDVEVVLARQDEGGIGMTVISDPHIWYGERDPGSVEHAREYNDYVAELVSRFPDKLAALGTVTPWRGPEQIIEAERAVRELGLSGLAIATSDRGRYLDSVPPAFWELVERLDISVFIHPPGTVIGQELMDIYRLGELCGRPLDTTASLARFILTGTAARFPGVRLLCSHAGGGIAMIADRLDFGHELRDHAALGPWGPVILDEPPSHYVKKLYLDTVTYGPAPLRLAHEIVGSHRLCFGTDGPPVPFAASRMRSVVDHLDLTPVDEEAVLGGNAAALFRLGE